MKSTEKKAKILITGVPGVGKTTLLRDLASSLSHLGPVGFYTAEIREAGGRRLGFSLDSLDGMRKTLAHVDFHGPGVGRYGVDVAGFEDFLRGLPLSPGGGRPVIIDEIGKMECLSVFFIDFIKNILDSPSPLLATIAMKGGGAIAEIKDRPDVEMMELTRGNRDRVFLKVRERFA